MISGKNFPISSQHRRGLSLKGVSREPDDNLDLFSKSRRSVSVASSDESDVSVKLGRLSIGSVKQLKSGLEDLLASTEGEKHDYDWLLTPPGTPLVPPSDGSESKPAAVAPRGSSLGRSASTTKASRLSVSHSECNAPARPTRSNSVTRPSISSSQYSTYSNKSSSILNTSSASVSSYIKPSTPTSHSSSSARSSTPTSRATMSRPSTPSKARQALSTSKLTQSVRPSTPASRPQISGNLSTPASWSTSRPSTPTCRTVMPSSSPASRSSTPAGRSVTNGRSAVSVSRPSSPSPQVRRPSQPIVSPDFSLETPTNLRTTLPDRPLSAGRSRPNPSVTTKGNAETPSVANPRRQSSPIVSRGRLTEPPGRGRVLGSAHLSDISDSRRASHVSELSTRKPVKTATDSMGLGRTISKKSLDVAIRHMDIRNGLNGVRPISCSTVFPHSIRSTNVKGSQPSHGSTAASFMNENASYHYNGNLPENGNFLNRSSKNGSEEAKSRHSARLTDMDIYESSRYDALLLKEDLMNTYWLHSIDDKSDQETIFDNGFESLPEPFSPLQLL
ncbi:unnamed protein product [Withania somnifera]